MLVNGSNIQQLLYDEFGVRVHEDVLKRYYLLRSRLFAVEWLKKGYPAEPAGLGEVFEVLARYKRRYNLDYNFGSQSLWDSKISPVNLGIIGVLYANVLGASNEYYIKDIDKAIRYSRVMRAYLSWLKISMQSVENEN